MTFEEKEAHPWSKPRPEPTDLRSEPRYPGLHTVVLAMSAPEWTVHNPSKRCPIEEPHRISQCGEFRQE